MASNLTHPPTIIVSAASKSAAEFRDHEFTPMRWGLIPRWWSKTIKDAKMATFNARAETI